MDIIALTGANNSGKTLSTKLIKEEIPESLGLTAIFREGMSVYQNFSILIYGFIDGDFVKHLNSIEPDILLEKTKIFHSEYISFGFYLKSVVSLIYGIDFRVLLSETEDNKKIREEKKFRDYLIQFAETAKKFDTQIWAMAAFALIENKIKSDTKQLIVINDLRSIPELDYILKKAKNCKVISIIKDKNVDDVLIDRIKTEKSIDFYEIENNGTIGDLKNKLIEYIKY